MPHRFTIVGLGEALFDLIGPHQRLGGAPLNVAVHAHQLLAPHGLGRGVVVSRVGQDPLGNDVIDQLRERGMDTAYLQTDPDQPTGRVHVKKDAQGDATYDIAAPAAYDQLWYDPELEDLARDADAVAFGSLAQRNAQSRNTIYRFLGEARRAVKLYDVNLRSSGGRDFYNRQILHRSCELATVVKLNHDELPTVAPLLGVDPADAPQQLLDEYGLEAVVITRGKDGATALTPQGPAEGRPWPADPGEDADTVGAGDSASAALLVARVLGRPWDAACDYANRVAAYVVGQSGPTPKLPEDLAAKPDGEPTDPWH